MKKAITIFFLILPAFLFSNDLVKIKDIRENIQKLSEADVNLYLVSIENKKIEKETGWIASIEKYDETNDIVFVEMDTPKKNTNMIIPDLFFIADKKISKRLSELQMIYFNAVIRKYDNSRRMIEVTNIFLSGIMR